MRGLTVNSITAIKPLAILVYTVVRGTQVKMRSHILERETHAEIGLWVR
jgi:hypothetical protein